MSERPRHRPPLPAAPLAALLLALPAGAFAAFEELGAGGRAPGMADAFVAIADDVFAAHYNPAGLGALERPQFGASYSRLYLGLTDKSDLNLSFLAYAQPLRGGRQGTLAVAWNSFALDGIYNERSIYLSYGRLVRPDERLGDLYLGLTLKHLHRSFGPLPEAANATQGLVVTSQSDPVLQNRSQSAIDADLGALYRFNKYYALGLQLAHVNEPNVAFHPGDSDRLPTTARLGFDYHSLLSNLAVQLDTRESPSGGRDNIFSAGAERWFQSLFAGQLGVRGGLGLGSRDYRQLSMGVSYRSRRLEVDYGFGLPIAGVASTAGNHRVSFGFKFGPRTEEEESMELVLEAMRQLKGFTVQQVSVQLPGLSPSQKATVDEYLAQARTLQTQARYREALDKLAAAMAVAPANQDLIARFSRLNFVAQQIPALANYKADPLEAVLHQGIVAYLAGRSLEAVLKLSEALRLKPENRDVELFLSQIERITGIKRLPAPARQPPRYDLAARLTQADSAIQEGRYPEAVELSLQVLREEGENARAWENLGTAYFALGELENSLKAWKKALAYEPEPELRASIKGYVRSIERLLSRRKERPAAATAPVAVPQMQRQQLRALYEQGIEHYARREFEQARQAFEKVLAADPNDVEALKALRRVQDELK